MGKTDSSKTLDDEEARHPNSPSSGLLKTCIAGAFAGGFEHTVIFPMDTMKTRFQHRILSNKKASFPSIFRSIIREDGISGLYRGLSAILVGALPSHAAYFSSYEMAKSYFGIQRDSQKYPHLVFLSGAVATLSHDVIVTPLDVIKQRMQIMKGSSRNFYQCAGSILKTEGISKFFLSVPTTLLINLPYQGVYFITYEKVKSSLSRHFLEPKMRNNSKNALSSGEGDSSGNLNFSKVGVWGVSGFIAGGFAGFITTPLDVTKTFIQTTKGKTSMNTGRLLMQISREKGVRALFSGSLARLMSTAPSSAICWASYETMKHFLGWELEEHA